MLKRSMLAIGCVLALSATADANTADSGVTVNADEKNRLVYVTKLQEMAESEKMRIIRGEAELTEYEKFLAKEFRLTEDDMKKYKKIMVGKRGIWSPGLDPISALGVEEKDPVERDRYAKLWLEIEGEKVRLQFEFERAVANKRKDVFGEMLPFNTQPAVEKWLKKRNRPNANIDVYVNANCLENCQKRIRDVQRTRGRGRLNFWFVGDVTPTDTEIVAWAEFHDIDPAQVQKRVITLNNGREKFASLGKDKSQTTFPFVEVNKITYTDD